MDRLNHSPPDKPYAPARATSFEPGATFGEYTIVRRIGRGGQGSVFEVKDGLGLHWALKVSDEMALQDANAEMRFAREARCVAESLSQLPRHSGVFVGEHYGVWDRRFYVKMKLLRGESLAQRLRRVGQLSIYEAVRIAERIAFAIGQAHAMGVLHRDLKPENVFLTEQGEVVVLDWGCLQLIEAGQQKTTLRGVVCTPGYAPIEQYLATTALNLTPAVDLYALGVMLYEALAGYHPFLNWSRAALNPPVVAPRVEEDSPENGGARAGAAAPSAQPLAQSSVEPAAERAPQVDGLDRSSVITVRVLDDVFAAQTERHVVPDELLNHLRSIVTGGITWPSAPERTAQPAGRPFGTAATQAVKVGKNVSHATEPTPASHHSGWTLSERRPPGPVPTRTMPHVNLAKPAEGLTPGVVKAEPAASAVAQAKARPPKGDVPRRFSVIEVLTFQEKVKPRALDGIPPKLASLLTQLLAKSPDERPQNALEVSEQLRALLPQLREAPADFAASTPEHNSRYLTRALLWIRLRQNGYRWAWAAAGVAVAGLTGAGVYSGMAATRAASDVPFAVQATPPEQAVARTGVVASVANALLTAPEPTPQLLTPQLLTPQLLTPQLLTAAESVPIRPDIAPIVSQAAASDSRSPSRGADVAASLADSRLASAKKNKRSRAEPKDVHTPAAPVAAAPTPQAEDEASPCGQPCPTPATASDSRNPRLQANPNAVFRRPSNQLWLE